jgi:arylsulfatase A-like enzyme
MTARKFIGGMLLYLALSATSAGAAQPNILFLMADDWSSPHAGVLGDPVVKTPTFDRVAREGVLFQSAFVSAPSCTPSRLAVATGQWHWRLHDGANLGGSLREGVPTYSEMLQAAGYQIGFARKGAEPSAHKYTHRDPFGPRFKTFEEFSAQRTAGAPFCFWYGAGEPHRPYRFGEGARAGVDPAQVKLPGCLLDQEITRRDFADYLHRIQRYDSDCARMLALLEKSGELENTIIVMSGDNGLPFPRCKATLYDTGTHVPLAIRWGATIKGGCTISDFVSLTDLAPTFLEAAGLKTPPEMTGRSLMPILRSGRSGSVDPTRTSVLSGMERHVCAQPARALRTAEFLYIRNFELKSWPTIDGVQPLPRLDYARGEWLAEAKGFPLNLEQSPTLQFLLDQRDAPEVKPFYERATGARFEEELYDLEADPAQLRNVAREPRYARTLADLRQRLTAALGDAGDPRSPMAWPERKPAPAISQASVDFNHPPRDYATHRIQGWDVLVEQELVDHAPELARRALARLDQKLAETAAVLPDAALADLRRVKIFLLFGPDAKAGGRREGLEYFQVNAALNQEWLDQRMARSIVIFSAANFVKLSEFWALKALVHEFGHAQHLEHWPEDRADIYDTWNHAVKAGLYRVVRAEDEGTHMPNYAAQNHLEYFAELTAMYFVGANYFPRDRPGLKAYDPAGHALVEKLWGMNEAARAEAPATK